MMFGSQASQDNSGRREDSASWEAPSLAPGRIRDGKPEPLKGSLSVQGITAFLRDNGRRVLLLALAIFAVGIIVLMVIPVRFAATALVVVDPREQRVTNDQDVLPGIGQDAAALQSLIEIAKSDGFLLPLIEQLKIQDDEDIASGETDTSRLLEKFRRRLDISRRGLTYVIAITFISNRPQQAARYANAVAEAFVATQGQVRSAATDDAAGWLNSRLKSLNDRLRASEDAVAAFKLDHKIVSAGRDGTTQQLRVTELNQQVSASRLRTEEAKTRYQQAQRDLKANVDGPAKQDLLSVLRAQRSALNDQIAQKRAVFGDRHPDLIISYSQLSDLNRQIENERKRNIDTAKSEYEAMLDQQKSLENRLKSVEAEMLIEGQAFVKLQELQRDADANKNIYEQFLSRFKTTDEQRLLQSSQTKIASLATPPVRSTRPPLALLLAAIAIASILISTAVVAVQNTRRNRPEPGVKTPRTPSPVQAGPPHDMPIWARIPDLMPPATNKTIWQRPLGDTQELDLIPHLRFLLDRIGSVQGVRGKVALVTSVENGVGCSTVARALNLSAVNRGMFSVLIQVQPDTAFARATRWPAETSANGLRASKATLQSINRLLSADRKAGLPVAEDIRSEFDLIVVDAPSLAEQPDVASLSAHADLVILVVRDGAADPAAIRKARASLWKFGGSAIGIVVNQVSPDTASPLPQGEMLGMAS
jgi:uncharacterized protein involved in exopolysaccharide biosynthesis/Mrp family chromosome partitioning ATPase